MALVIDCASRELLGWHLAAHGNALTAEAALEEALIHRFGHLGRVTDPLQLRCDNGLVFTSSRYTATVSFPKRGHLISRDFWHDKPKRY